MRSPPTSLIMLTGQATIEDAVEATKLGAYNFLEKPVDPKKLQVELRNCLERHESERHWRSPNGACAIWVFGSLVGRSPRCRK